MANKLPRAVPFAAALIVLVLLLPAPDAPQRDSDAPTPPPSPTPPPEPSPPAPALHGPPEPPSTIAPLGLDGATAAVLPPVIDKKTRVRPVAPRNEPGLTPDSSPDPRPDAIRQLLARWSDVLLPYADEMVAAADRHDIDWRLLPVIAILESGAGRHACGYNPFGYASCRVTFSSWEEAIEVSARTLASYGGDNSWRLCVWVAGPTGCRQGGGAGYTQNGLRLMEQLR